MSPKKPAPRRKRKAPDALREEFGPGPSEEPAAETDRPFASIPCGGDGCFLRPVADLVTRFALGRGHAPSLGRAAVSGIELMRALRDFLDEEIALAERAAKAKPPKVEKIPVD